MVGNVIRPNAPEVNQSSSNELSYRLNYSYGTNYGQSDLFSNIFDASIGNFDGNYNNFTSTNVGKLKLKAKENCVVCANMACGFLSGNNKSVSLDIYINDVKVYTLPTRTLANYDTIMSWTACLNKNDTVYFDCNQRFYTNMMYASTRS